MDVVACDDGEFLVAGVAATGHVSLAPVMDAEREKRGAVARALAALNATDYVEFRRDDAKIISPNWLGWRASLRAVVRGESLEIKPEPARYV